MKNLSLSAIALGLAIAFTGTANSAETSMNGWGKAYTQAAAKQSQVTASAQADFKVEANHQDDSNFRAAGDQAGSFVAAATTELAGYADRLKTTAANAASATSDKLKTQGSALANRVADSKPNASDVSFKANTATEASASMGRNVNGSVRTTTDAVVTAGRAAPRPEKPQTTTPEAPKAPDTMAQPAQPKPAQPETVASNEPVPETNNTAATPSTQGGSLEINASASASIGVNGFEMPSISRGVAFDRSALSALDRPVFARPETVGGLLR